MKFLIFSSFMICMTIATAKVIAINEPNVAREMRESLEMTENIEGPDLAKESLKNAEGLVLELDNCPKAECNLPPKPIGESGRKENLHGNLEMLENFEDTNIAKEFLEMLDGFDLEEETLMLPADADTQREDLENFEDFENARESAESFDMARKTDGEYKIDENEERQCDKAYCGTAK